MSLVVKLRGSELLTYAAVSGFILGLAATLSFGAGRIFRLPALSLALSRAIFVAKYVFQLLQFLGLEGFPSLVFSLGLGIFLNNLMVIGIIAVVPILIFKAKPFSDKHFGKLYQRYGLWLFKPIGWKAYRVLATILPFYALALQFYLIGGTILSLRLDLFKLCFLIPELSAIIFTCLIAVQPSMSENPLDRLPAYSKLMKKAMPIIISILFLAA
ncbi:MAG: hypothetical protein J7L79_00355, partial [Thaumarchaeota archaeon]|nr:hypothetical protein [Nitrososphaerota archaeon]